MDKPSKPEKLQDLLGNRSGGLGKVLARAASLEALTDRVAARLPGPEAEHIVAVSADAERLVVTVDSAAWAARLRFMEKEIRAAIGDCAPSGQLLIRVRAPIESQTSGSDHRT